MKILVTGSQGRLGKVIVSALNNKYEIFSGTRNNADITNQTQLEQLFNRERFDTVIHCAALTDVNYCEHNQEETYNINVRGTENIARLCAIHGTRLIHMSSNYVFSGEASSPYTEEDKTGGSPNFYGKSKELAEEKVLEFCPDSVMLRISWLYGKEENDFVSWVINKARNGESIKVINDQLANPTNMHDIANQLPLFLDNKELSGIFHLINEGATNRYEMAKFILKCIHSDVPLIGVSSKNVEKLAIRPDYSVLLNKRLNDLGLNKMPDWENSLSNFIACHYNKISTTQSKRKI